MKYSMLQTVGFYLLAPLALLITLTGAKGGLSSASALGKGSIGIIVAIEGTVIASQPNKEPRTLSAGSPLFAQDVISISPASKAQAKFTDGTLVNLIESTEFRVKSYRWNERGRKNSFSAELIKGGFRTLTGSIGKKNPSELEYRTPTAQIGLRGTLFEANFQKGTTFIGCSRGSVVVSNKAGQRILTSGKFVSASSWDKIGEITNIRPDELSESLFSFPEDGETFEESDADSEDEEEEVEDIEIPEDEGNPSCG
jgi:hypothetical protein